MSSRVRHGPRRSQSSLTLTLQCYLSLTGLEVKDDERMKPEARRKKSTRTTRLLVSLLPIFPRHIPVCIDLPGVARPQGFQKKAAEEKEAARYSRR